MLEVLWIFYLMVLHSLDNTQGLFHELPGTLKVFICLVHKAKIEVETRTHLQQFSIEKVHVHVCSVIETRQSKATMPKDNSSFSQEKK